MNTVTDDLEPFESPKILIEGAKTSIPDFESACQSFINSCRYSVIRDFDLSTGEEIIKLRIEHRIPGELRRKTSTIVNDLRHALDQAVCDAALLLGRKNAAGVFFPFGKTPADLDREFVRRCKGVDSDLVKFIRAYNAYYGGDAALYALGALAGPNKHQRILRIFLDARKFILNGWGAWEMRGPLTFSMAIWNDRHDELEIARVQKGGAFNVKVGQDYIPLVQIVLNKGEPPLSGPASTALHALARKVESIVFGIEAESRRILKTRS